MSVGDVNSTARGSGARYNDDKPALDQIPMVVWEAYFHDALRLPEWTYDVISILATFQERGVHKDTAGDLWTDLMCCLPSDIMKEAAQVFTYGADKYAQWNWCKGMSWNIPLGCMLRHFLAAAGGERNDPESGLSHLAHAACNIIMLYYFSSHYTEGEGHIFSINQPTGDK